ASKASLGITPASVCLSALRKIMNRMLTSPRFRRLSPLGRTDGGQADRMTQIFYDSTGGSAVLGQPVEMLADMRRLGRRMGERDGAVEGGARLILATELQIEPALNAEEVEIAGKRLGERRHHGERRLGAGELGHGHGTVERHHRRGLERFER